MALRLRFRLFDDPVQVTRSASASPMNWLRPRFSLRLLFAAAAVAAVVSAYLARAYERDHRERAAVRAALDAGGSPHWEERHRFAWLPGARRCTKLNFGFQPDLASKDLSFLGDLPSLRWLYMSSSSVTDDHMRSISRVSTLEFLNIGGSGVTDTGLALLRNCPHLRTLYFSRTAVKGGAFEQLRALPELEQVNADDCEIDDRALALLGQFVRLRTLEVSSDSITDRGAHALCGARELEDLILLGNVTPSGIDGFFALPRLKYLTVHGRGDFRGTWCRKAGGAWRECGSRGILLKKSHGG